MLYNIGFIKGLIYALEGTDFPEYLLDGYKTKLEEIMFSPETEAEKDRQISGLLKDFLRCVDMWKEGTLNKHLEKLIECESLL